MTRRLLPLLLLLPLLHCGAPGGPDNGAATTTVEPTVRSAEQLARDRELEREVAAVIDTFANFNARISPDGRRTLFLSDRSGTVQVHLGDVERPDGPALRLTDGAERVHWATFTADGAHVIFLRDTGGDENYRFYRVGLDGVGEVCLTPGETMHRDIPVLPRDKPDRIFYTARDAESPSTRLFELRLDGGEERVVYMDPHPCWGVDATPDGRSVLLRRFLDRTDQRLLEVSVSGGTARQVYPREEIKAGTRSARYAADAERIYVATDEGGEESAVLALDTVTGAVEARYVVSNPPGALVAALEASPDGSRLAVLINAGNRSEMRVLRADTLEPVAEVALPLGMVEPGGFTRDGSGLALTLTTPEEPWDVYLADAASGSLHPLRDEPRPGFERFAPIDMSIEVVEAFDGASLPLNLYRPRLGDQAADAVRLPAIVFLHGGPAWSYQAAWDPLARFFVNRGYAFVAPNVRGSIGFGRAFERADNRERRADVLRDLESVHGWLRSQPWCDGERLVVAGLSYGGYLTLMALTRQPDMWSAGVDIFGVADLRTLLANTDPTVRVALIDEFGDPEKDAELLERFSPMRDVDRISVPLFVYAGQNDPRVPRSESDLIVGALRERGVPVEYMVAAGEGHSFGRRETMIEMAARIARFLEEALEKPRE